MSAAPGLNAASWAQAFSNVNPFLLASLGSSLGLTLCVLGAAWCVSAAEGCGVCAPAAGVGCN